MKRFVVISFVISFIFLIGFGVYFFLSTKTSKKKQTIELITKQLLLINEKIEIDALNKLSYRCKDTLIQSYNLASKALVYSRRINYKKGEAISFINLCTYYYNKRNYLKAFECLLSCKDISESNNLDSITNEVNYGMGVIFLDLGRKDRAFSYVKKTLNNDYTRKNLEHLAGNYIRLGQILYEMGDTNGSLKFYLNALSLKPKLKSVVSKIWVMKSIGNLYLSTKHYDIASYYYSEALNENKNDIGNLNGTLYSLLAETFEQKHEFNEALNYHKSALQIRRKEAQPLLITSSLLNIGHIFLKLEKYDSSLYYLKYGLKQANYLQLNFLREKGYNDLYELYLIKQNWRNAFIAFKEYNNAEDLVENEKNNYQVALLENNRTISDKEKQTEELKAENAIQKLEIKNHNLLILVSITLSLLLIALVIYIQQLLVKNKRAKQLIEEENDQLLDEIKEQVEQNEELVKREEEYRFLADNTADLVTLMDRNFKCLYVSPSCESFLGYSPDELMNTKNYRDHIHPDSRASFDVDFERMIVYKEATRFRYQAVKKDGTFFWVESNINPIFDSSSGKLRAMLFITRDISDHIDQEVALMEASKQKELLISEVHHRVKNNLAVLTSLVNMQKSEFTDHKTLNIFSDLQFRVRAMALVHEQLYKSRNVKVLPIGEYLANLVGIVSSAYSSSKTAVHQVFYEEIVDVDTTLPLGLIVNELLTNAFKYAFPDNKEGNIWVTYEKIPGRNGSTDEMRNLTVRDDGIGLPDNFDFSQRTSMGSQIIHLLTQQLEGEIIIDKKKGACFSIILPAKGSTSKI